MENMQSPQVSVIVPAFKIAPYIAEAIDGVVGQTFTDWEVIVINDGSPDTVELEQALAPYLDKIVYIKQENKGAGAARNAGMKVARGEYVAFLDGDDIWLPNFLSSQLELIQSDGGYDLVYADAENFGDPETEGHTSMETNPSEGEVTFTSLIASKTCVITSGVLVRRQCLIDVGYMDDSFPNSQDFDLWLRLARDAHARITYQRTVLVRRRLYPTSLAGDAVKSLRGELAVLNKTLKRPDLTQSEKELIEEIIQFRQAMVDQTLGKRSLLKGEYRAATESFVAANRVLRSWKLSLVLMGMRVAPGLVQRASRSRSAN
ncbi:MAG TPA: glycosyltransferase family 2 protein [Pyrinomonadaceae bacterium]|jgi:Glycosyltransferases involved in cell wall biogenesis|nr:glycosyltransferase family 2 protein [Pyrinomonadaceae bacterium]